VQRAQVHPGLSRPNDVVGQEDPEAVT